MRHPFKWALLPAALATLFLSSAHAQTQRVRVITASHLPPATEKSTAYAAHCGQTAYQLIVTPADKTVILRSSDGPDVDLGGTSVGTRLLEEDVLVEVGFNCPYGALNIFLKGVKLVDLGQPSGFRDHISVKSNGELGNGAPVAAPIDELAIARPETALH